MVSVWRPSVRMEGGKKFSAMNKIKFPHLETCREWKLVRVCFFFFFRLTMSWLSFVSEVKNGFPSTFIFAGTFLVTRWAWFPEQWWGMTTCSWWSNLHDTTLAKGGGNDNTVVWYENSIYWFNNPLIMNFKPAIHPSIQLSPLQHEHSVGRLFYLFLS